MTERRKVRIALLGGGVVGGGVMELLRDNAAYLADRVGAELEIAHVLVRDSSKTRAEACRPEWLTTDPGRVFGDDTIDVFVELMGGADPALSYVERAIDAGCGVVSANKLLLAKHGAHLVAKAKERNVDIAFEASVGGGVPIIRTLRDSLASDWVTSVHALLNGTCNYVLTRMFQDGVDFDAAVADAQRLGYAEADPTLDVDGFDAAQKLVVLSMLAFGAEVDDRQVHIEGIRAIDPLDFKFAARFSYAIKHLAVGIDRGERVELRVHPALVPASSPLGGIHGVLNGAYVRGRALGPCLLVGAGAGDKPTAVSVVADIVDVARARVESAQGLLSNAIRYSKRPLVDMAEVQCRYYLRFEVSDQLGVLGRIAGALGNNGVSVEHMVQDAPVDEGGMVPILMITHLCKEGDVSAALSEIAAQAFMVRAPRLIRIEDL